MWQIQATGSNKLNHTDIQKIEWEVNCKPRNWMFFNLYATWNICENVFVKIYENVCEIWGK